jgi:hypothetical protein
MTQQDAHCAGGMTDLDALGAGRLASGAAA